MKRLEALFQAAFKMLYVAQVRTSKHKHPKGKGRKRFRFTFGHGGPGKINFRRSDPRNVKHWLHCPAGFDEKGEWRKEACNCIIPFKSVDHAR